MEPSKNGDGDGATSSNEQHHNDIKLMNKNVICIYVEFVVKNVFFDRSHLNSLAMSIARICTFINVQYIAYETK